MTGTELWDVFVQFPQAKKLAEFVEAEVAAPDCREIRITGRREETGADPGWFGAVLTYSDVDQAEERAILAIGSGGNYFVGPYPRRYPPLRAVVSR